MKIVHSWWLIHLPGYTTSGIQRKHQGYTAGVSFTYYVTNTAAIHPHIQDTQLMNHPPILDTNTADGV